MRCRSILLALGARECRCSGLHGLALGSRGSVRCGTSGRAGGSGGTGEPPSTEAHLARMTKRGKERKESRNGRRGRDKGVRLSASLCLVFRSLSFSRSLPFSCTPSPILDLVLSLTRTGSEVRDRGGGGGGERQGMLLALSLSAKTSFCGTDAKLLGEAGERSEEGGGKG
eukprot:scaffold20814_cov36-Tisochrysis_lutea.AAC.2